MGQSHTPFIDPRLAREHLADAERFDRLAKAFEGNPRIAANFARTATEARSRAARCQGVATAG